MRKSLPVLAVLAFLALPGCILAIGDDTMSKDERSRISSLEKRVSALEKHELAKCGEDCKYCDHG